jgi:hypothetical protein
MAKTISTANAILSFIDRVKPKTDTTVFAAAIAQAYSVTEGSPEFYFVLHCQADNFSRLLGQIELAEIGEVAKKNFLRQTKSLASIVAYKTLSLRFDHVSKEFVQPNRIMLTYIDEALKQRLVIDDALEKQLSESADQLEEILDDLLRSEIPGHLRAYLKLQITRLVLMLRNLDSFSGEQIWEQSSATQLKLFATASNTVDGKGRQVFGKLTVILGGILGVLTAVELALDKTVLIGRHIKEGQELIEQWRPKLSPPKSQSDEIAH